MPEFETATPTLPRVRLLPWRGPFHMLLLLVTCSVTLLLPLLYAGVVLGLGWIVAQTAFEGLGRLALAESRSWRDLPFIPFTVVGAVTWLFMLRPLLPRPGQPRVALRVTPAGQPELFGLVREFCRHLRLEPPVEVWLDTTTGMRTGMRRSLAGVLRGEMVLTVGLPVVAALGTHEFAALLARTLALNAGGLGSGFAHLVHELDAWFFRALHERDPWEQGLRRKPGKETRWQACCRRALWLWMTAAKLPFAFFVLAARVINMAALLRLESVAEKAALRLAGTGVRTALRRRRRLLEQAWDVAAVEIQRGVQQHRLPDNLPLLLARHVARGLEKLGASGDAPLVEAVPPLGAALLADLPAEAPAASLVRCFVDLSRQLTCFYYQHELGIQIHEHRLVAEEEVLHQNRREDESLLTIRRYFGGLAHPERALCGHAATHSTPPGRAALAREIQGVRVELREWGLRLKPVLQEWNLAWQRRRDLEAAAVLSLAGFNVSRIQFGTEDVSPGALRQEAARQRMLMEHMESTLTAFEAKLESRFAAALGLLWWSEPHELDETLLARRRDLPHWVAIYEAMAGPLPSFRELLTTFFAFQTLGARFTSREDSGSHFAALQSVVPKMINLLRQILSALDGAHYPFGSARRPVPLAAHLLPGGKVPEPVNISMDPAAAANIKTLSIKMAADASEIVAPFVDRYLHLWHQAYAWLAESAELAEGHFLDMAAGNAVEEGRAPSWRGAAPLPVARSSAIG